MERKSELLKHQHMLESGSSSSSSSSSVQFTENERRCLEPQNPEELKKSKYDLPIEFHPKTYEQWIKSLEHDNIKSRQNLQLMGGKQRNFEKYILSQKTSVMYLCEGQKPTRVSRFQHVKGKVLLDALNMRPNFYAFRLMAIHLLRSTSLLKLQIMTENEICPSVDEIPHRLFSWSAHDFIKRRQLDSTTWLEVFERDFKDYLEIMKFKFDMKELVHYLDMILCGALIADKDFSFENGVVTPLEDASDLLTVFSRLKSELIENRHLIIQLRVQYQISEHTSTTLEEEGRAQIMHQLAEVDIIYPIKYRYQKAWYEAQVDQVELKQDNELRKLKEQILFWTKKISDENVAMQNFMSIYYSEIEYYKIKISEFNTKFENEYDDLDNAINYKRMAMSKLEIQRKYCEEQIDQMREKVAEDRAKKLFEKQEKIRLEKEQATAELLKIIQAEEKKARKELKEQMKRKARRVA